MNRLHIVFLSAAIMLGYIVPGQAAPVQFGDHYYEYIVPAGVNDWFDDQTTAHNSIYLGVSGHLATITSSDENLFIFSHFATGSSSFEGAWLGGKAPEGWLDGPEAGHPFGYTNWGGIEPNNAGYAYINLGTPLHGVSGGQWADDSGIQGYPQSFDGYLDPVVGYIVEYDVPEPATLALLALGGLALIRRRRK